MWNMQVITDKCASLEKQDFAAYAGWLKEYSTKFLADIHAWILMSNHVHLLCTP